MGVGEAGVEGVLDLVSAAEHHPPAAAGRRWIGRRRRLGFPSRGSTGPITAHVKPRITILSFFFFLRRYDWYLERAFLADTFSYKILDESFKDERKKIAVALIGIPSVSYLYVVRYYS